MQPRPRQLRSNSRYFAATAISRARSPSSRARWARSESRAVSRWSGLSLMAPPETSHHPRRLLLGRHAPIRREVIYQARQLLAEPREQLVAVHAGLFRKRVESADTGCGLQTLRRDRLVRPVGDPGLRHMALSVVLEIPDEVAETAAEHAACAG